MFRKIARQIEFSKGRVLLQSVDAFEQCYIRMLFIDTLYQESRDTGLHCSGLHCALHCISCFLYSIILVNHTFRAIIELEILELDILGRNLGDYPLLWHVIGIRVAVVIACQMLKMYNIYDALASSTSLRNSMHSFLECVAILHCTALVGHPPPPRVCAHNGHG